MLFGGLEKFSLIDYPGKSCAIAFTVGCNFLCPYCHNPELIKRDRNSVVIPEKDILSFLKTRVGKLDALSITGGEPTLHSGLVDFMTRVKDLGFLVKLDSNGTNPNTLKEVLEKKVVDYIAMDIKAPLLRYERVTTRPVDIGTIEESIGIIKSSDIDHEFRTTIVRSQLSKDDILQIGDIIAGAKRYYLQKFVPTKVNDLNFMKERTYSDEEFEELRVAISRRVGLCEVR